MLRLSNAMLFIYGAITESCLKEMSTETMC